MNTFPGIHPSGHMQSLFKLNPVQFVGQNASVNVDGLITSGLDIVPIYFMSSNCLKNAIRLLINWSINLQVLIGGRVADVDVPVVNNWGQIQIKKFKAIIY